MSDFTVESTTSTDSPNGVNLPWVKYNDALFKNRTWKKRETNQDAQNRPDITTNRKKYMHRAQTETFLNENQNEKRKNLL